ncbi:hypothetical protein J2X37_002152 [Croceicoccus sp. BE223]|nr:hypothetical protein [Croceicoccus sp. BE223]
MNMVSRVSIEDDGEYCRVFFVDERDAMIFKLVFSENTIS